MAVRLLFKKNEEGLTKSLAICINFFELTYLNLFSRVEIEQFGHGKRHTFCAQDRPFYSSEPQRVQWMPNCRDNERPDQGATFLGTVLNSDPVGNAKYVFDQVR